MKKKSIVLLMTSLVALNMVACGASGAKESKAAPAKEEAVDELTGTQQAVVMGDDWGPAVTKTVLHFDNEVDAASVNAEVFSVSETKEQFNFAALAEGSEEDPTQHIEMTADRTVTEAYTCDKDGNKSDSSEYVALELYYSPNDGSPFCYDLFTSQNTVCDPYQLQVSLKEGKTLKTVSGDEISKITGVKN